jgi:pimeloyl-ACP methyl ester carboxylesterase
MFDVGPRTLYLRCTGRGAPTLVLEAGEGAAGNTMQPVRALYETTHEVCTYDRANVGRSGQAPVPRTSGSMVQDLHRLLAVAKVPGPYLLVGHSAGALLVQAYARQHLEEVAGVVAMNPVPPWVAWSRQALPQMTQPERQEETAYYKGENGESIDYRDLSHATRTSGPRDMPFRLLISTIAQCESPDDVCGRTYAAYETIMQRTAADWAEGQLSQVDTGHDIYIHEPSAVQTAIDDVLASDHSPTAAS